ncbi:MAG: cupin domain-containing protein [Candidatus Aegiribacteria sp.]|nr:cupin domain-containing protein [Candidatus Aegiribacteria sp.]
MNETARLNDHRDDRGYVINPFEHLQSTSLISNCHIFSIEPGHVRGNHTHPGRNEEVIVIAGELVIRMPDQEKEYTLSEADILKIDPGVCHIFANENDSTAVAICWSSRRDKGYEGPDTVR